MDVSHGSAALGNLRGFDGAEKGVLRAPLASPLLDLRATPPPAVFAALSAAQVHSHRKGKRGTAYSVLAALAALFTGGPAGRAAKAAAKAKAA